MDEYRFSDRSRKSGAPAERERDEERIPSPTDDGTTDWDDVPGEEPDVDVDDAGDGRGVPMARGAARGSERPSRTKPRASAPGPGEPGPGASRSACRYTVAAKVEHLRDFAAGTQSQAAFCRERGLNTKSFGLWRRAYKALGEAGLMPRLNRRNTGGRTARPISPEERRALVEAYLKLKLPQAAFAKTYGISVASLTNWLRAYRQGGPKGLEPKKRGRKSGQGGKPLLPVPVRESIVATKRRFPSFGLKKIRDYLLRFFSLKVSPGGVRATLERSGLPPVLPVVKKRHRSADQVRRFERSRPQELWQSDITSFVLRRESRRVYLTVFLDDFSRYVVAFRLAVRQTADLVCDALLEGVARFGKPLEVLTDQGRQYFAWRGKSEFQKLLEREGIRHVVSRAHHPETLGKCERLWSTVGKEFWERAKPQDLEDAKERLMHFFAHYNHFRPHQSLQGLVPADRFFGQADAVRKALEEQLAGNELLLSLDETPRKKVFLMGQVGEQKVSLRGERGRLVIETEHGLLEAMSLEEVGNDGGKHEHVHESKVSRPDAEHAEHDEHHGLERDVPRDEGRRAPDAECVGGAGVFDDERDLEHDDVAADVDDGNTGAHATDAQASLQAPAATGDRGEGIDPGGDAGRASEGACDMPADPGLVARQEVEAGSGTSAVDPGAAGLAVEPTGTFGDDRGPAQTATPAAEGRTENVRRQHDAGASERSGERSGSTEEDDPPPDARAPGEQSSERSAAAVSVFAEGADAHGGTPWREEEAPAIRPNEDSENRSDSRSEDAERSESVLRSAPCGEESAPTSRDCSE